MHLVFRLTLATPSHAQEIAEVYVRTRQAGYAPFYPLDVLAAMSVPHEAEEWRRRTESPDAETILAIDSGGAIAGFTHINWHDGEALQTGEVEFMYVATEHQGKGLGATLMAEAESWLTALSMRDAVLWVYEGNTHARGFYERCGWHPDGALRASNAAPGLFLARYRKPLQPEHLHPETR